MVARIVGGLFSSVPMVAIAALTAAICAVICVAKEDWVTAMSVLVRLGPARDDAAGRFPRPLDLVAHIALDHLVFGAARALARSPGCHADVAATLPRPVPPHLHHHTAPPAP